MPLSEEYKIFLNTPAGDPRFAVTILRGMFEEQKEHPLVQLFELSKELEIALLCEGSRLQDSLRFRMQWCSSRLADYLLDERGELIKERIDAVIRLLEEGDVPSFNNDPLITERFLKVLKKLQSDSAFFQLIRKIQKPLAHKRAEEIVKETAGVQEETPLTDRMVRLAVLSALLSPLRQSVGSCFATAPAILIHEEQLENFVNDLFELLSTGKLKRIFGGVEFSVPMSLSSGIGDLKKRVSLDFLDNLLYSPGLLMAFCSAGVIDATLPPEQQIEKLGELIAPALEQEKDVEGLIRASLLGVFGLTADEVASWERSEKENARTLSQNLLSIAAHPPTKRKQKVEKFLEAEKRARAAFKRLTDNPLLKVWEFTLASLSEVKMEFSRWNLYKSLGLDPHEKGGIGEAIYSSLQSKLDATNQSAEEAQKQYEIAFDQVRGTEVLLRRATSEGEVRRLRAEHQARLHHMYACLDLRDRLIAASSQYVKFFSFLINEYIKLFQEYFQEIYDPEMQNLTTEEYADSPAGFRLVYKHGRRDPSTWTLVHNEEEYITSLVDFFLSTEATIASINTWEEGSREITEITTAIVHHLRSHLFLESAFMRMTQAHGGVIGAKKDWSRWEKKPWAYTSGGTVNTLLEVYFKREIAPTREARWVESETDLLIFLLDTMKALPPFVTKEIGKNRQKRLIMTSPNHAFTFLPGMQGFFETWQENQFSYTWVRDEFLVPQERFYKSLSLSESEQLFLVEEFADALPILEAHRLRDAFSPSQKFVTPNDFREGLLREGYHLFVNPHLLAHFDAFLYKMLPLIPEEKIKQAVSAILSDFLNEPLQEVIEELIEVPHRVISAASLREIALSCLLLSRGTCFAKRETARHLMERCRKLGFAPPAPLLFADTNWPSGLFFAFLFNPGSHRLELWRVDRLGTEGVPMSIWKPYLDGTYRDPWTVYIRPSEYS